MGFLTAVTILRHLRDLVLDTGIGILLMSQQSLREVEHKIIPWNEMLTGHIWTMLPVAVEVWALLCMPIWLYRCVHVHCVHVHV